MSEWSESDTVGFLSVVTVCVVITLLAFWAFRSWSNDPNSYINIRNRTEERLERIEQKLDSLLESKEK